MMQEISIMIPAVSLFIYIILSSIEFGAAVFQMWPTLLSKPEILKNYIQPVWEVTNVFLVFTIICLFTFFPSSSFYFGTYLLVPLFSGLIWLALRAVGMLLIFYGNVRSMAVNIFFLVASLLAPVTLSNAYVYILTGQVFNWGVSLALYALVVATILLLAGTFFQGLAPFSKKQIGLQKFIWVSLILFVVSTILFVINLAHVVPSLLAPGGTIACCTAVWFIVMAALAWCQWRRYYAGVFGVAVVLVGILYFGLLWQHLPYLIYPNVTIYNSFMDPALFPIMMTSFVVGMLLVIPSLWLLYALFLKKKN